MRKLSIGLGAVSLFALIAAGGFWHELNAERQRSSELLAKLDEATRRLESLASPRPQIPTTSAQAMSAPVANSAAPTNYSSIDVRQETRTSQMQRAAFAQIRLNMPQRFPGLMAELGLTPDHLDRLFDLLVNQQAETRANSVALRNMDEVQRGRSSAELKLKQQTELSAMLGAKLELFEEYKKTQPARQQVADLRTSLEYTGSPLREDQVQLLNKAMIAERQRLQQEEQEFRRSSLPRSQTREQNAKSLSDLGVESDRRVLSVARTFLTESQARALQLQIESRAPIAGLEGMRSSATVDPE